MVDLRVPQSGMNAFQKPVLPLKELLASQGVKEYVTRGLLAIFSDIGLVDEAKGRIVNTVIQETLQAGDLLDYERRIHRFLEENEVFEGLSKKTADRAQRMVEVVLPWLVPGSVLDLGCGPGGVGKRCAEYGYKVTLADVYQSPAIPALMLPFVRLAQNADLPFKEGSFDNILIFAMLHHVEDPLRMISEVKRTLASGGRLHLIETVYGLDSSELSERVSSLDQEFAGLSTEEQRLATMFFDYFGNHVTWYYTEDPDKYIPVPFNFNTPSFWRERFGQAGFRCLQSRPWQIDPASGVFHYLLTLER
jgi:SAM-dependent methyltransferase